MPFQSYLRSRLIVALAAGALCLTAASRAQAEAVLLFEAATGKVLHAENATYPWYPASVTKLMTLYTTFRAMREGRVKADTLLPVTSNAVAQQPTKMGFKLGATVTVDNALKMLMVKSANDVAVVIAEGIGGSIEGFSDLMNANARRLGMTQSNFVNPHGLPAENHVSSARDLGLLARAVILEFPEYDSYLHVHAIRYGNRIMRNYNSLLDRYPGADGMKTGFICASGYNVAASATRNGRRLIVIVLGSYSGATRAQKAAQLLERGFNSSGLNWLTPSLGTVAALAPIDAQPPNLRDEMCGGHRRKPPSEDNQEDDVESAAATNAPGGGPAFMLSNLQPSAGKFVLGPPVESVPPVVVFTGPANNPDPIVAASPAKKRTKKVTAEPAAANPSAANPSAAKPAASKPAAAKPAAAKPAASKPATSKPAATKPATDKPAAKPVAGKPAGNAAKPAPEPTQKPKVSSATQ